MVVLGDTFKKTAFILKEGTKTIYQFSPQNVAGDLDPQDRTHPARLEGAVLQFTVDASGAVQSVSKPLGSNRAKVIALTTCGQHGAFTMTAKSCRCGNTTNGMFERCNVCAIKEGKCAACGAQLF